MKISHFCAVALLGVIPLTGYAQSVDSVFQQPATPVVTTQIPTLSGNPDAKSVTLSLAECIEIALTDNPTIRVADMEVQRVDYAKSEARAGLWPQIDFSGQYQRSIKLQTMSMSMGGQSQEIQMGTDNNWNFGFSARMPLIMPTLWKSIQLSDTQILSALEDARSSRLQMVNNVNNAYYALLLAIASHEVLVQNYDITCLNAEIYKKRFEAGTATEYDVLRSSVQIKNLEPQILQAQISIRQCKLQLAVLLGMTTAIDINPDITLKQMQQDMYGYAMQREKDLSGNSSLRSLDIQTRMLEQSLDLKKFAFIPTLSTQFNIAWSALSNGNALKNQTFHPYSNVALALSVPIFSGGSKYYGVKQAKVQLREMKWQRENLINSLNMQIEVALDNINMEAQQIETNFEGVRQAEKAHQIIQKSFEIGAASYLDLRDAELAETSAKLSYYQAIYNYLISSSDLDLLLGRENYLK